MQPPNVETIDLPHWTGHVLSLFAWVGALLGMFPAIAGFAALVWYTIQIYESATIQKYMEARRTRIKTKRVARLRAEQRVLVAELEALEVVREARVVAEDKVAKATHEAATQLAVDASDGKSS